jgi:hypothetical protein
MVRMGLIAGRPEEPSEWAGLPSEPVEPGHPVERLGDGPTAADWTPDLLSDVPQTSTWIEIPVEPTDAPHGGSGEGDGD